MLQAEHHLIQFRNTTKGYNYQFYRKTKVRKSSDTSPEITNTGCKAASLIPVSTLCTMPWSASEEGERAEQTFLMTINCNHEAHEEFLDCDDSELLLRN